METFEKDKRFIKRRCKIFGGRYRREISEGLVVGKGVLNDLMVHVNLW